MIFISSKGSTFIISAASSALTFVECSYVDLFPSRLDGFRSCISIAWL